MQETLHYLLMSDHQMIQKALVSSVKDTGLTPGQPKVLDYLLHHNGAIQKEIAIFCHIEPASLTAILNGMENKGYIERKTSENNRRSLHVYLTETGKKYADRLNLEFNQIESEALNGFSETEAQQLHELLSRVYKNMVNFQKKEGTDK
ncbi:MarR family winged helix-turn-helix transcriptional regulator [Blautia sp. MSJ-19]|uniref:MarR family winged helix-turn-helix transcriptional regulator n=1 Tax=Blautia sp. MSJ-19 TaxID=2841517 RepID=UPI001C0E99DB|nr:MarR family transcriptional regulator [Blautia sp. MSJ-19]MBU5481999.1 MarR family transcriptional regulator [Blautia sp. MSJ-19]